MAQVSADLVLNIDEALAAIEALGELITDVTTGVTVEIEVEADTAEAQSEIEGLEAEPVEVPVEADVSEAEGEIDSLDADTVVVPVEADVSSAEADIGSLDGETVEITVEADTAAAQESLDGLAQSASEVGDAAAGAGGAGGLGGLNNTMGATSIQGAAAAAGIGALATGVTASVLAFADADAKAAVLTQAIGNLGAGSGVTVEGVQALATQLQQTAGVSDEATQAAATLIARFGTLNNRAGEGNDIFDRTLLIGADLATLMGTDITSAANTLGRALADPERGMSRLERQIGPLDEGLKNQIITMQQSGDVLGAQRLLLDAVADAVEGTAAAYGESLAGKIDIATEAIGEAAEAIGGALAPAIEGALDDTVQFAESLQNLIGAFDGLLGSLGPVGGALGAVWDAISAVVNPIGNVVNGLSDLENRVFGADKAIGAFSETGKNLPETLSPVDAALATVATAIDTVETATTEAEQAWETFSNALVANTPDISSAIQTVEGNLNTFGQTIDDSTDAQLVIDNLGQMVDAFNDFADNIATIRGVSDEVAQALAPLGPEIAGQFVQALANGRPGLIRQLEGMLGEAEAAGLNLVDVFGGAATDSSRAVEQGLRNLPSVTRSITERSIRAVEAQRTSARNAGRDVGDNMTTGVERGVDGMSPAARRGVNDASNAARAARNTAASGGRSVGNALVEGMAEGIASSIPAVTSAARAAVAAAVQAAQNEAGISSPSKVFMEMGLQMGEGMAIGLGDSAAVVAAAEALTAAAAYGASSTVYDSTVQVSVDARGASDPQAVGDAVAGAVEASLFRASVVGARRRRG